LRSPGSPTRRGRETLQDSRKNLWLPGGAGRDVLQAASCRGGWLGLCPGHDALRGGRHRRDAVGTPSPWRWA